MIQQNSGSNVTTVAIQLLVTFFPFVAFDEKDHCSFRGPLNLFKLMHAEVHPHSPDNWWNKRTTVKIIEQ